MTRTSIIPFRKSRIASSRRNERQAACIEVVWMLDSDRYAAKNYAISLIYLPNIIVFGVVLLKPYSNDSKKIEQLHRMEHHIVGLPHRVP